MIPVSLDPRALTVALAGHGSAALRRWRLLQEAGAASAICYVDEPDPALEAEAGSRYRAGVPDDAALAAIDVLWVVGIPDAEAGASGRAERGATRSWSMSRTGGSIASSTIPQNFGVGHYC